MKLSTIKTSIPLVLEIEIPTNLKEAMDRWPHGKLLAWIQTGVEEEAKGHMREVAEELWIEHQAKWSTR